MLRHLPSSDLYLAGPASADGVLSCPRISPVHVSIIRPSMLRRLDVSAVIGMVVESFNNYILVVERIYAHKCVFVVAGFVDSYCGQHEAHSAQWPIGLNK
ncbi:hypothetical protein D3C81_1671190 [compost metagenome]